MPMREDDTKITLKQLRYFAVLSETCHFGEAARRLRISQPSLSAQLALLEETLGLQLVERSRRGVHLTPFGRDILVRTQRVLGEVGEIVAFSETARSEPMGTISLGAKPTLAPYLLPHVVVHLHSAHPSLRLYVRGGAIVRLAAPRLRRMLWRCGRSCSRHIRCPQRRRSRLNSRLRR